MKILVIDSCVRGKQSRTARLLNACLKEIAEKMPQAEVTVLELAKMNLSCLYGDFFEQRQELLAQGELNAPRFDYAHQFADADKIVIAAPFWDLNFPALFKVYIENISVDGITFYYDEEGCHGKCKSDKILFLTTRGGYYEGDKAEQACGYIHEYGKMCGIQGFQCIAAEGLDFEPQRADEILETAYQRIPEAVKWLAGQKL